MDRDHDEALPERLPEDVEFRPPPEAVDEHVIAADSGQRALRPDAESVRLPFRVSHPADRLVGDWQAPPRRLLPHHVAHPDD